MAESTWDSREQKILEAVHAIEERDEALMAGVMEIAAEAGIDERSAEKGISALMEAGFMEAHDTTTMSGFGILNPSLSERGRRAVGQWPSENPADALIQLLDERLAQASSPDEASALSRLRDAAVDVSQGVLTGVLTALVRQQTGI